MTRYIDHKHGLIIGSNNVFFFTDACGKLSDNWRSIVWAKTYSFNNFTGMNLQVRTPAFQLIWEKVDHTKYQLTRSIEYYLNQDIGARGIEWDARPEPQLNDVIFFRTRKNGMKFINLIKRELEGMRFE